jgi:hypothetical protein
MSTLGGVHLIEHQLRWSRYGSWYVEGIATEGDLLSGVVEYSVGSLTMRGTVKRSDFDSPDRPHSIVWGGLGWHSAVTKPISLQSDSGIRLSTVLTILATGAGEPIEQPSDVTIGNYYECTASRPAEPVHFADALNDLVRSGFCPPWRVDADGVTRFGPRTPIEVTDRATHITSDRGAGAVIYGIDDPVQFAPGNTINGQPIERVVIRELKGKLTAKVFGAEAVPPLPELVRRMVRSELLERVRTYVVQTCHADGRCDLSPPVDAPHLPELRNVEQWCLGNAVNRAKPGDEAIVVYTDIAHTRPKIVGFKLGPGPFAKAATVGSPVSVFFPPECPLVGLINGTTPFAGTLTILTDGVGQIADGNENVGLTQ